MNRLFNIVFGVYEWYGLFILVPFVLPFVELYFNRRRKKQLSYGMVCIRSSLWAILSSVGVLIILTKVFSGEDSGGLIIIFAWPFYIVAALVFSLAVVITNTVLYRRTLNVNQDDAR